MPLVATLLHQTFGLAPTLGERPEMVVAKGSLRAPASTVALGDASVPRQQAGDNSAQATRGDNSARAIQGDNSAQATQGDNSAYAVRPDAAGGSPAAPADPDRRQRLRRRGVLAATVAIPVAAAAAVVDEVWPGTLWELRGDDRRPLPTATVDLDGRSKGLAINADRRVLATADDDTATLWNIGDRASLKQLATLSARAVDFTADGQTLVTASRDGTVQLWDVTDPTKPTATHRLTGDDARFGPGGVLAVNGCRGRRALDAVGAGSGREAAQRGR